MLEKNSFFNMTKIFVNKNAIKPYFSPKWGKTYGVGNVLGIFANFPGNSGENFIATLLIVPAESEGFVARLNG